MPVHLISADAAVSSTAVDAIVADGVERASVILVDATTALTTITLPALSAGVIVIVKKVDVSANAVDVATPGAETIDGAATLSLAAQYNVTQLVCDGTNWFVI